MNEREKLAEEKHDFWHFFGLSYNPYLVVPRSLLQSMPQAWQHRMVAMLEEMCETPAGKLFIEAHYLVQRTDPDRDDEIHDASLHNQTCESGDEREVPAIRAIDDPFKNYRHPSDRIPWKAAAAKKGGKHE